MKTRLFTVVAAAVLAAVGCKSTHENERVDVPDPLAVSGDAREWWDVYNIEYQGDRQVKTKVGYVYRKYDERNRGAYMVKNLALDDVGFLLPDLRAFRITPSKATGGKPESVPLGQGTLPGGVKKILQLPGDAFLDPKLASRPAPVPAPAPAPVQNDR